VAAVGRESGHGSGRRAMVLFGGRHNTCCWAGRGATGVQRCWWGVVGALVVGWDDEGGGYFVALLEQRWHSQGMRVWVGRRGIAGAGGQRCQSLKGKLPSTQHVVWWGV